MRASATSSPWPLGSTFSKACVTRASGPMMNVVRAIPIRFTPKVFFSTHTPYASAIAWSSSTSSVNGSPYFFLNFVCDWTLSGLTPKTSASMPSNRG